LQILPQQPLKPHLQSLKPIKLLLKVHMQVPPPKQMFRKEKLMQSLFTTRKRRQHLTATPRL